MDAGIISLYAVGTTDIHNKLFENMVYLDLRRKGNDLYCYHTQDFFEVDFVSVSKDGSHELIQVTLNMNSPDVIEREQRALSS